MNVISYVGPGIQLVSFDPKSSISMVGREVFASTTPWTRSPSESPHDASVFDQEACLSSRLYFVEGESRPVDRFCGALASRLGCRALAQLGGRAPPAMRIERDEIEVMEAMDELSRLGSPDGTGS